MKKYIKITKPISLMKCFQFNETSQFGCWREFLAKQHPNCVCRSNKIRDRLILELFGGKEFRLRLCPGSSRGETCNFPKAAAVIKALA